MRQILELDQNLAAKPEVRVDGDAVYLSAEGVQLTIPSSERKNIRIHIDRSRAVGKRIDIEGWAFGRETEHPIKRIYMSFNGRIVASGQPVLRTDVRRVFHLDYDHYGFKIQADSEFSVFDGDGIDLFVLDGAGLIHVPTTIKQSSNPAAGAASVQVLESSVVLRDENHAERREFAIVDDIKLHVDRAEITKDEVKVRGWCFDQTLRNDRPLVCAIRGETIISGVTPCRLKRFDVVEAYGLVSTNPYQGFEVKFSRSDLQEGEPLKVLAVTGDDGNLRAAVAAFPSKKIVYRD